MKKTLVALASMAALGAFAQSSVTMYGLVEATVDLAYKSSVDTRTDTVNAAGVVTQGLTTSNATTKAGFRVQDGNSQGTGTSRIGWRGTEDLGGGLKANFQLEMGLRIDDGCVTLGQGTTGCTNSSDSGGNVFGRNAWVGAAGGFGEVRLGRQVVGSFGTQANGWSAGSSNGLYDAGSGTAPLMGGVRFSNAIRYITPNMGGLTGSVMFAAPESTTTTNNGAAGVANVATSSKPKVGFDLALDYANGPLYVGFGHNSRGSAPTVASAGPSPAASSSQGDIKAYTLSAAYDLGVVKPYFNYTRQKSDSGSTTAPTTVSATSRTDKAFSIGVRAPLGAMTLIAGFGNNKIESATAGSTANILTAASGTVGKVRAFQIGMQYPLSKRTLIEANYGQHKTTNDAGTSTVVAGAITGGSIVNTLTKVSAMNVGLRHSF